MHNPSKRPALARLLDLGDRMLRAIGIRRRLLTPEGVKADAVAATGLGDFGPPDFEEGLAAFCRSAEQDARLDIVGREIVRRVLRRVLCNRLLLVAHRKRDPQLPELVPPVIVLGLPRTGTTILHRLLAQDPGAYGPPAWLVWRPLPRISGADRRREITGRAIVSMRRLSPELDIKHYQAVDEPEECYHLLDPSLRSVSLAMLCQARSYFDWAREQDMRPAYQIYHEYLRIIQAQAPGRRLTLKTPLHTPFLEEIVAEIPSVRFVQTHRDPVAIAGSLASLCYSMFAVTSTRVDAQGCGRLTLDLLRWMAERNAEQRQRSALPVVDVRYRDLVSDPVATVHRVHEEHGLGWSPEIEAAVRRGAAERPQHKQGKHRYQLEDFGLSESAVIDAVSPGVA
jgi:hypothetical protein